MPAIQRGHARRLPSGKWQLALLRRRRQASDRRSRSRPRAPHGALPGRDRAAAARRRARDRELTLAEFVDAVPRAPRARPQRADHRDTTAAARLRDPTTTATCPTRARADGRRARRLAGATLPPRIALRDYAARCGRRSAAAVRWGYMSKNPANARSARTGSRHRGRSAPYTFAELDAIDVELAHRVPAARRRSSLRPGYGRRSGRRSSARDIDRRAGIVSVRRTVSDGEVVELGKTSESRRGAALTAAPSPRSTNSRPARRAARVAVTRERAARTSTTSAAASGRPAIEAQAIATPARIYDLRSTFASNALAAGVTVFELAPRHGHVGRDDRASLRRRCSTAPMLGSQDGSTRWKPRWSSRPKRGSVHPGRRGATIVSG